MIALPSEPFLPPIDAPAPLPRFVFIYAPDGRGAPATAPQINQLLLSLGHENVLCFSLHSPLTYVAHSYLHTGIPFETVELPQTIGPKNYVLPDFLAAIWELGSAFLGRDWLARTTLAPMDDILQGLSASGASFVISDITIPEELHYLVRELGDPPPLIIAPIPIGGLPVAISPPDLGCLENFFRSRT